MIGWAWITIGAVVLAVVIMQIAARFADYDEKVNKSIKKNLKQIEALYFSIARYILCMISF